MQSIPNQGSLHFWRLQSNRILIYNSLASAGGSSCRCRCLTPPPLPLPLPLPQLLQQLLQQQPPRATVMPAKQSNKREHCRSLHFNSAPAPAPALAGSVRLLVLPLLVGPPVLEAIRSKFSSLRIRQIRSRRKGNGKGNPTKPNQRQREKLPLSG